MEAAPAASVPGRWPGWPWVSTPSGRSPGGLGGEALSVIHGGAEKSVGEQGSAAVHPAVEKLEQRIAEYLEGVTSSTATRQHVEEMLDDGDLWELFAAVVAGATTEAVDEVADSVAPMAYLHAGQSQKLELAWRLAVARGQLFRDITSFPAEADTVPEIVLEANQHPDIGGAFVDLAMANFAAVAIGSSASHGWPAEVVSTLIEVWIEGERAHYSYLVPLASALGLPVEVDQELLPDGVMDLEKLAEEVRTVRTNREKLLDEARRSGQAVYPAPDDD